MEKGKEYLVTRFEGKRASRMTYEGVKNVYLGENYYVECHAFHSLSSGVFYSPLSDGCVFPEAKSKRQKSKKGIVCTKCHGAKIFKSHTHTEECRCFKRDGTGVL